MVLGQGLHLGSNCVRIRLRVVSLDMLRLGLVFFHVVYYG